MASKNVQKIQDWEAFFSRCMRDHVDFPIFQKELSRRNGQVPLNGRLIYECWAREHKGGLRVRDRLLCYFELLLQSGVVTNADVIQSLCLSLETTIASQESYQLPSGGWRQTLGAAVLERMAFQMTNRKVRPSGPADRIASLSISKPLVLLLSRFCKACGSSNTLIGPPLEIGNALGQYVAAYITELSKVGLLTSRDGAPPKDLKTCFGRALPPYIAMISRSNAELGQGLDILHKQSGLYNKSLAALVDDGVINGVDLNALTYQESILDTPLIVTRAALYIYLNAMLTGRPICEDVGSYNYLNSRYNGEIPTLVTDLITASFDVLANAINRTESNGSILAYRSFLTNKLPVFLEFYSSMIFPPLTIESCITTALNRMDPPADPYSTQSFDLLDSSGMLSEARAEFLFSCALYGLIPEQSIESILGDVPMQNLPEAGKYVKADLVTQCTTNSGKIEELVGELENMEGNAAEIAGALIEIIQSLCAAKDSITLKITCNALSRKPQALDVLMLFCQPNAILQPLCGLLDHWQVHEDQGEHHPVYDEFGSIFLFIFVFRRHFNLQDSDLGIGYSDSFVLKYIRNGRNARHPSDLTEQEYQLLGGWIKGLFETEVISDELISTCSPKDFHLLVATLFDQSLRSCEAGLLGLDNLKRGFEYLLESFLLPSLIAGLTWFAHRLLSPTLTNKSTLQILLSTLTPLIHPPSLASDASSLHSAVITITAPSLSAALSSVQKIHPTLPSIDPLLATLKSRFRHPRSSLASQAEIDSWCSTPGASILGTLQNTVTSLVAWSTTGALNAAPPNYTHRLLLTAVQMAGPKTVLEALLDAVMKHAANGPPDVVLDVVTAMVCAPVNGEQFSLRQALHSAYNDVYALSKRDAARAEIVVRLQRRVETQGTRSGGTGIDGGMGGTMDGAVDVGADGGDLLLAMSGATAGVDAGQEGMAGLGGMLDVGLDMQMADMMGTGAGGDDFLGL
ncbi:mediator complex subunit [Trapelia coarctata]|nr:mediator complex subunit [Trapelia coarctata]